MDKQTILDYYNAIDDGNYLKSHVERLTESHLFIDKYIHKDKKYNILDLGSYGHFTDCLKHFNPNLSCSVSDFDLRYEFPLPDKEFDFIFCMEVLEHIKDRDSTLIDDISVHKGTGALNMMCEISRILKNDGFLFLTTPNASTLLTIIRVLCYGNPNFFAPHVKEYSLIELKELIANTGFAIIEMDTKNVWGEYSITHSRYADFMEQITKFCKDHNYNLDLRGDDSFLILKKISRPKEILAKTEYFEVKFDSLFF